MVNKRRSAVPLAVTRRVLIVDDSEPNRKLPALILGQIGYDIVEAGDGATAIAHISASTFDCVLLDLNLPDMHGSDVCAALRAHPAGAGLRIIAYSSHEELQACGLPEQTGFDGLLLKPLSRKALIEAIAPDSGQTRPKI